jgi:putative intracellular protease/amidase
MGGVTVLPTCTLSTVDPTDVAILILPGGDRWEGQPPEPEFGEFLYALDRRGVPIAAICAATIAVARLGLLRGRRHTSNGLAYLRRYAPEYTEATAYIDAPAVRDRGLITASGLSDVEFATEIMAQLGVLSAQDRERWQGMFRKGRVEGGAA